MISYKTFKKAIDFLHKEDQFYTKQWRLYDDFREVIGDSNPVMYTGAAEVIVTLLEEEFGLLESDYCGTDLSWWIYDTNFGEDFEIGDIENMSLPEDHKYRKPDLSDTEKLYEYLVWQKEHPKDMSI